MLPAGGHLVHYGIDSFIKSGFNTPTLNSADSIYQFTRVIFRVDK